ncbi:MAG: proteasome subunit beta [Conexivisphaera sp.]|jgi:proteasome beta subunit
MLSGRAIALLYNTGNSVNGAGGMVTKTTGTTTVGLIFNGGVVLATDKRVTMGYFIAHRQGRKIYQIDDHLGITISGVVADAQAVIDVLRYGAKQYRVEQGRPMPVRSAASMAANLFFSYRLFPLIADVLIGGFDGSPGLYNIDFFGAMSSEKYVSTGSGSPVAYGVLESGYREGLSEDDAVSLAVKAVHYAMKRDSASGDGIDAVILDARGYREVDQETKRRIVSALG